MSVKFERPRSRIAREHTLSYTRLHGLEEHDVRVSLNLEEPNTLVSNINLEEPLRDSQSLVLGGNGFPPDPLQPSQNFLSVHVVMGYQR